MMKWIERFIALVGAFFFAQFPQFYLQYLHRVEGHLGELIYHVSVLEKSALLSKKSLPELIDKFLKNSDLDIVRQGELMQGILNRYTLFVEAETHLAEASLFFKPFQFFRYLDAQLAKETFHHFQPGISLTFEGFFYALLGFTLASLLFQGFKAIFKKARVLAGP